MDTGNLEIPCPHSGMSLVFAFSQPNLGNVLIADPLTCVFEVAKKNVWTVELTFLNPAIQALFMGEVESKGRQRSMRFIRRLPLPPTQKIMVIK